MQLLTRKFTIEQYHKMADAGILTEQDRVELIRGKIIEMSPIGLKHAATVNRLNQLFYRQLGERVVVSIQNPIQLNDNSEPQPDVALLKPRADFYENKIPTPEDILLLVEVADKTLRYDRDVKLPLYAENKIIEVWLIDVNNQFLRVYRQPQETSYQNIQKFTRSQNLSPLSFSDIIIPVDEIFGFSSLSN
jgi:Uma2 family endonuclease